MPKLYAPDGALIVGTLDLIPGVANVYGATRLENGELDLEYAGGTDVDWDGQKTVTREGERVFVDEEGGEWLESELVLGEEK